MIIFGQKGEAECSFFMAPMKMGLLFGAPEWTNRGGGVLRLSTAGSKGSTYVEAFIHPVAAGPGKKRKET
jgi:hypothetical protein